MKGTYVLWGFLAFVIAIVAGLLSIVLHNEPAHYEHSFKRIWVLGGSFTIPNTNITNIGILPETYGVMPDSNEITGLKGGYIMDGVVYDTFIDTCFQLYIVGNFSAYYDANDFMVKPTKGPIIMYNIKNESFVTLPGADRIVGTLNSVTVDCLSIPASIEQCSCLVYIGGHFQYNTTSGFNGSHVMKYDTATQTWDPLAGHDIRVNDTVSVVQRRNFGVELKPDRVFVGGSFGIRMFNVHTLNWTSLPSQYTFQGVISDIFYHPKVSTMFVFLGGNFSILDASSSRLLCKNLCKFHFVTNSILNFTEHFAYPVHSIDGDANRLFVGGLHSNVSFASLSHTTIWNRLGSNDSLSIQKIAMCRVTDLGCERGSVFVSAPSNVLYYYYAGDTVRTTIFET
eukprot:CAMPEP_0117421056 /NCGR_PEP_ID=MMETSP0758-20121206/2248_1 /TAXON_ID=63605 /ORGANISM="Percolomonas cosmopolitus, Strain AE-1 (ATCC 50343)" /LENGTH=396 /DNA_ID=CAMNT_0005202999 /DNA_START=55 /DNA_END=1241 /DNA_ORIENTATION=+